MPWATACAVEDSGGSGDANDPDTSDTTTSITTTSEPTDGTTEPSASTDPSDPSGDSTTDGSTASTTGSDGGLVMHVVPSSRAVLEADDGGALGVSCHVLRDGVPVIDAAATVTIAPTEGVTEGGAGHVFESFGIHEVTCEATVDGEALAATTSVAVLNEIIDPRAARVGEGLGVAQGAIFDVLASSGQDDAVLLAAMDRLAGVAPILAPTELADFGDVLRPVPGEYYPTASELDAMGITANADDAMLAVALDDLDAALVAVESTVAAFDPAAPTEDDAAALAERGAQLEAAVTALRALEPTAHGLMATRARVAELLRDRVAGTTRAVGGWVDARVRAEADVLFAVADPSAEPLHFGFLSLTLGMFGDSYLQIRLVNEWYGDYIAQLDESFNNFILAGAIDYFIPLGDNSPTIDLLVASASVGFATPGYPSWVDGYNFHEDPEMNLFLVFGDSWQGIVDAIISACGIEEADTIPEKVETLVECFEEIEGAVDSIFLVPMSVGPGLYGSPQGLDLGEFPEVCGGGLPTATFLLPISYTNGRGPNYFVNCI